MREPLYQCIAVCILSVLIRPQVEVYFAKPQGNPYSPTLSKYIYTPKLAEVNIMVMAKLLKH